MKCEIFNLIWKKGNLSRWFNVLKKGKNKIKSIQIYKNIFFCDVIFSCYANKISSRITFHKCFTIYDMFLMLNPHLSLRAKWTHLLLYCDIVSLNPSELKTSSWPQDLYQCHRWFRKLNIIIFELRINFEFRI